MLRKCLALVGAIFCLVILANNAQAQLPQIATGLAYLTSAQSPNGNWDSTNSQVETTVATTAALESLKLLNQIGGVAYSAGISWLQAQSPQSVDFIAKRILALELTDGSVDALLPALDVLKGGWGGYDGYAVNILDTAYALQALQATGSGDISTINAALAFLTNQQNADGGWGFLPGDASSVYLTAVVSSTLQQFPQITSIATAVSKAGIFLLKHQNADGGFGSSLSTVYETALAYAALAAVFDDPAVTTETVNYLTATQAADGSWNDDPYSTALAIRALYLSESKPSPPPSPPPAGTIAGILVDATTHQRLDGVKVVLASNPLVWVTTAIDGSFILNDVPAGSQQVNFSLEGYKPATATVTVAVDTTANLGNIVMVSSYSTGIIAGMITDSMGRPLADVAVSVNGAWSGNTVTEADGSFVFSYVTPGEVVITAAKDGYQNVTVTGTVFARTTLTFSPRLDTASSQTTTGRLVGRVVEATWGVPIDHLPDEKGVTVTLSGGIAVEPDPDNGGRFDIPDLAPNTYQVTVGMNGFASQTFRVVIAPGVTTDLGTIRLEMSVSKMTLTGKVTDAESGAPVPGATISVDGTMLAGSSDFSGTYAIANIDHPAQITVKASADGYIGKTFTINTAPWTQSFDIVLSPKLFAGSVKGKVVDASLGTPLAGVALTLMSDPATNCVTDSAGNFIFPAVASGIQQIELVSPGYAARTLTTTITAGQVNDVGNIGLGMYPLPATIQGRVWDSDADGPFAGVEVQTSGSDARQVFTAADGSYRLDNVNPGTVIVSARVVTKPGYQDARISAPLEAGGILVFNPALSTTPRATVDLAVQTDKEDYQKGETGIVTVYLKNQEDVTHPLSLHLFVVDPAGGSLFESVLDVTLPATGTTARSFNIALPADLQSGLFRVTAEAFDADGTRLGSGSKTFGVAVSRVSVTPTLPTAFVSGANTVSFNLHNVGTLAVSAGVLAVALKDPDGQVVFSTSQSFSLALGDSLNLPCQIAIPDLKFGNYTLSYTLSDETHQGPTVDVPLPNSLIIDPLFSSASHRVGATANLTVYLSNAGRFEFDTAGTGLPVTVSVPDAGYEETKILVPAPRVGSTDPAALLYGFTIPASLTAGLHGATITVTLPSGSSLVKTTQFAISDSDLSLAPLADTAYLAGETITPKILNNGGADTRTQCRLSLYDAQGMLVAERTVTGVVAAGSSLTLSLSVPTGSVDGQYRLVVYYKDLSTGEEATVPTPITIQGVTGTLQVQTDKQTYLQTETITGLSSVINGEVPLVNGTLLLQVTAATGNLQRKTWTSQNDFQQGRGSGVDTVEVPDAVTLVAMDDDFDDGVFNPDRWNSSRSSSLTDYPPLEQNGTVQLSLPSNPARNWISNNLTTKFRVTGDFDTQVDYNIISPWNYGGNNHAAGLQVFTPSWNTRIDVWGFSPTYGTIDSYGSYTNVGGARLNGRLRITRVGSNYYVYYWNGSRWIRAYSFGGRPSGPAGFTLMCFGQGGNVQVLYDNFTVVSHTYPQSGTLKLRYDSGRSGTWGNLDFQGDIPSGTSIKFRTRSADTEAGLASAVWSDYLTVSGSPITSPEGRWLEVETTLATTDTTVSPTLYEVSVTRGHQAGDILWQTTIPANLAQGETFSPVNTIGALGTTGKFFLQGLLYSSTGQIVTSAEYPFYVEQGNIQIVLATDKKIYRPGETVSISGEVLSLSSGGTTGLSLNIADTTAGSAPLHSETFDLVADSTHTFSFTATAEAEGVYSLGGIVEQNGATLAAIDEQYEVASPAVTATVTAPETAGNDSFPLCITLNNSGKVDATVAMRLATEGGAIVDVQTIDLAPGESQVMQYPLQIVGATTYLVEITGDLEQTIAKKVVYVPAPLNNVIAANIVTDKVSYNPNEVVSLTSTVTASAPVENLSARISVTNSQGQSLYSATVAMPSLVQGQTQTINKQWGTRTNPAGTYTVSLQILNSAGVVVADSFRDFTINATTSVSVLLKGQLSLDKQSILAGEPVRVTYSVVNVGNVDLSSVALSVRIVDMADQTVYDTIGDQTSLTIGSIFSNSGTFDTQSYSAKDYAVILLGNIDGEEQALASTYLRVEGAPSAPTLAEPAGGADVVTFTPALIVNNAADPNHDNLIYEYEVYADSNLTDQVATGMVAEMAGITQWIVPTALSENQTYFWRARAYDGQLYGPWMALSSFRVNTINDPPSAPNVSSPADGSDVGMLKPVLTVTNASDPDSSTLTYNFTLSLDPDFSQVVASATGITGGQGTTSWAIPNNLQENTWYYWRVQADDWLVEGPWSETASFLVNTANDPPSTPVIVVPVSGSVLSDLSAEVVVTNSSDPDSPVLSYYFEADEKATFNSANLIRSGMVVEGQDTTLWNLSGLKDNSRYYVRVKASDGMAESPWSDAVEFFVNTVNDRPTVPTLNNPSNGTGVKEISPALSVHNSIDLDGDNLFYVFEVYSDASMTNLIAQSGNIAEMPDVTVWTVPLSLTENQTYYWHARCFDGSLYSGWMPTASFLVNTSNDAPGAPQLLAPADGRSLESLQPTLTVVNALDPDSGQLTYDFEVYRDGILIEAINGVPEGDNGTTSVTLDAPLTDNTSYSWRARAFDGGQYGEWMNLATFTIHQIRASIKAEIKFEPKTLNKRSKGTWIKVDIVLPDEYEASAVDISSLRFEGVVPAETRIYRVHHGKHGNKLTVKFRREQVISLLPVGEKVLVHVTGDIGPMSFEGIDIIRVIDMPTNCGNTVKQQQKHQEDKHGFEDEEEHSRGQERDD
ncbi:hypothetical protein C2E25_08005 [Geothermobacter hydrogeniphilus]|uniref:Fibronectin type-III domain-containing protein n=1 Tax=Geothermobacter hydrogeniphilus TaxID=1969733 RepID=A0A2K2HAR6_9BACT|nr:carboxypeptidase regulatory-like domain-containing protein [Geothermobacter hydrogeniphilus]PNU20357.1 hypothetical protein C2E25_08005 [Geothermobacter hydrogeniphilus]